MQRCAEIGDEANRGLMGNRFIFIFVGVKSVAIVVALQASEKTEEIGREVGRHGKQGTRSGPEK